jgi:hypothetical protein
MRLQAPDVFARTAAAPFAWLAVAAAVAGTAVGLAFADAPFLSIVLAVVGLPLAAYATAAVPSRASVALAASAFAADLIVIAYWVYALFDALRGAR